MEALLAITAIKALTQLLEDARWLVDFAADVEETGERKTTKVRLRIERESTHEAQATHPSPQLAFWNALYELVQRADEPTRVELLELWRRACGGQ
jgi:hypothetical protein